MQFDQGSKLAFDGQRIRITEQTSRFWLLTKRLACLWPQSLVQGMLKYELVVPDRIGAMHEKFASPHHVCPDFVNRPVLK